MKKFLLFAFAFLCFTGSASAAGLDQTERSADTRIEAGITKLSVSAQPGFTQPGQTAGISRRKKPRLMTIARASRQAWQLAEYLYTDPEANWTGFGADPCRRLGRSRVSCYSYVTEDLYDEYGYYDTMVCDWFTVSYFTRSGQPKIWAGDVDCVYLSEI